VAQPTFGTDTQDAVYNLARIEDYHRLNCPSRVLYQKVVQAPWEGTTGITSASAAKTFSDTGITTTNTRAGMVLQIREPADGTDVRDNGDYEVISVATGSVVVDRVWPWGSLTGLSFRFYYHDHHYDPATSPAFVQTASFPFVVMLNPSEQRLTKYGFDRARDAIVVMSAKILTDLGITPHIGDRFKDPQGNEHEIQEMRPADFWQNSSVPLRWVGASDVTHKNVVIA